jgi:hypothetical protein
MRRLEDRSLSASEGRLEQVRHPCGLATDVMLSGGRPGRGMGCAE